MTITGQNRNTWIFIGLLLLAGICYCFSHTNLSAFDSLMNCVNYVIFTGLLLFWIQSVRVRLLPSAIRTCISAAAYLMLFYMLLRIFKYRFAVETVTKRFAVYAYWIPQMMIPALFLMACIRIRRGEESRNRKDWLWLIPGAVLASAVMTNDLHGLVYAMKVPVEQFAVDTGTYSMGPVFYLLYVWMAGVTAAGIFLLFFEMGRMPKKAVWYLLLVIALWSGLVMLNLLVLDRHTTFRMFNVPECHTFGMLGVLEVCIRHRLIPHNENYRGFFRALPMPVLITDRAFHLVFRTQGAPDVRTEVLRSALAGPVDLTEDHVLYGKQIRGGYAFWAEDESGIRLAQERLAVANETIRQENDLIRAETEQKEKEAYLRSRHRIYHEIAAELYPVQKQIEELLEEAVPGADDFTEKIASVSVLNAYVKRKTNLLLLAAEEETLRLQDLFLALQESAVYLTLAGLQTTASVPEDESLPARLILALYDSFQMIADRLTGRASSLMVSWNDDGLRLAAETDHLPDTAALPLPVVLRRSEEVLYMVVRTGKDGDAS